MTLIYRQYLTRSRLSESAEVHDGTTVATILDSGYEKADKESRHKATIFYRDITPEQPLLLCVVSRVG